MGLWFCSANAKLYKFGNFGLCFRFSFEFFVLRNCCLLLLRPRLSPCSVLFISSHLSPPSSFLSLLCTHSRSYCVDAGKRENLLRQVNATLLLPLAFLGICRRFLPLLTSLSSSLSFFFFFVFWKLCVSSSSGMLLTLHPRSVSLPPPAACAIYAALSNPKATFIAQLYLYLLQACLIEI